MNFPDNDLPVRTPFMNAPAPDTSAVNDEVNYDTLTQVHSDMADKLEELQTIHAINLSDSELKVKQQIKANQIAYDILLPIYQSLDTAIQDVKAKQQARY